MSRTVSTDPWRLPGQPNPRCGVHAHRHPTLVPGARDELLVHPQLFSDTSPVLCPLFAALPRSRSPTYDSPPATVAAVPRRVDRAHLRVRAHELVVRAGCGSRRTRPVPVAGRRAVPAVHADRQRRRPLTAPIVRNSIDIWPDYVVGDRGYDAAGIRRGLRFRHIVPLLVMRRTAHGSGLGRWRWVLERTFAWLSQFRRLRVRYASEPTSTRPSSRSGARSFAGSRCAKRGRPREAGARNRAGVVKAPVQRRPCGKQGRRTTHSNSSRMCERPAFTAMRSVASSGDIYLLTGVKRSALRKQLYLVAAHEGDGVSGL